MKNKFSAFIVFYIITINVFSQKTFNKAIPSFENNADAILCQATLTDSNNIVTFINSYDYIKNKWVNRICKLDTFGNLLELRTYLDSIDPDLVVDLKQIQSGYLVCGYQRRSKDTIDHFWYAKLDNDFDTLWTKSMQVRYNFSSFNRLIELKNGNIALCGIDHNLRPNRTTINTLPVVAITDSFGVLKYYLETKSADTAFHDVFFGITEGHDGSIYPVGYIVKLISNPFLDQDPIMAKVSSDGKLLWRKQIDNKGFNEIFLSAITQQDGSILGVGASYNDDGAVKEFSYVLLMNFNTDGNINWTRRIFKGKFNDCYNSIQDKEGNIIGAGLHGRHRGGGDTTVGNGWIFKCSAKGDSIWSRVINHDDTLEERFNNISQAADGGFYLTGYSWIEGDNSSKGWIVKTDSFGCVVPGCEKVVSTEDIESRKEKAFLFFPNPVHDHFFFLSRVEEVEKHYLMIYDLQGRLMQTYPFTPHIGHQYQVDIKSDIASGNYLLQIRNGIGDILFGERILIMNYER